jgi:hypothetical protein
MIWVLLEFHQTKIDGNLRTTTHAHIARTGYRNPLHIRFSSSQFNPRNTILVLSRQVVL